MHWLWRFPEHLNDEGYYGETFIAAPVAIVVTPILFWLALSSLKFVSPDTSHLNYEPLSDFLRLGVMSPIMSWIGFILLAPTLKVLRLSGVAGILPTLTCAALYGLATPLIFACTIGSQTCAQDFPSELLMVEFGIYGLAHGTVFWGLIVAVLTFYHNRNQEIAP